MNLDKRPTISQLRGGTSASSAGEQNVSSEGSRFEPGVTSPPGGGV